MNYSRVVENIENLLKDYDEGKKIGQLGLLYEVGRILSPIHNVEDEDEVLKIFITTLTKISSVIENTEDAFVKLIHKKFEKSFDTKQIIARDQIFSLYYPLERSIIEWESNSQKCSDLVRLGDKYLKESLWSESEEAYSEAFDILRNITITNTNEIDIISRLSCFGYGYSLFAKEKFEQSMKKFIEGLYYFPNFPLLDFDIRDIFKDEDEFDLLMENLKSNEKFEFLIGFFYHFSNQKEESKKIFEKLSNIPESKLFLKSYELSKKLNLDMTEDKANEFIREIFDPKTGIEIKDRKYRLKTYQQCFIASDLVSYIQNLTNCDRNEITKFIQKNIRERCHLIRHVVDEHEFQDEYFFFGLNKQLLDYCFSKKLFESNLIHVQNNSKKKLYGALYEKGIVLQEVKGGKFKFGFHKIDSIYQYETIGFKIISSFDKLPYTFLCENEDDHQEWMKSLEFIKN